MVNAFTGDGTQRPQPDDESVADDEEVVIESATEIGVNL
jgi:hypothetical protein